jgi:hypothetical protein
LNSVASSISGTRIGLILEIDRSCAHRKTANRGALGKFGA